MERRSQLITCLPGSGIAWALGRAELPGKILEAVAAQEAGRAGADCYDVSKQMRLKNKSILQCKYAYSR